MTPKDDIVGLSSSKEKERRRAREIPEHNKILGLGTLCYRKSWQRTPAWVTDFFDGAIEAGSFIISSASSALLVEASGRQNMNRATCADRGLGRIGHFHVPGCGEHLCDVTVTNVLRAYAKGLSRFEWLHNKYIEVIDSYDGVSTLFKWRVSE